MTALAFQYDSCQDWPMIDWRPIETLPPDEVLQLEDGTEYHHLPEQPPQYLLKDSTGMVYVAQHTDADFGELYEWAIWTGEEEVPLVLEDGVTLTHWSPVE